MATAWSNVVRLVEVICGLPGNPEVVARIRHGSDAEAIRAFVAARDTAGLYDRLMGALSLQGVSDRIALGYIADHGNATWRDLSARLTTTRCACPKLAGFEAFTGCGYRKTAKTCARPQHLRLCPVRQLPLRKGALNVQSASLLLFVRDLGAGDLVGLLEETISAAQLTGEADWAAQAGRVLVGLFSQVEGVSSKLANMVMAELLLAGRPDDPGWQKVGLNLVTVDSLVLKLLDRTGVLEALGAPHAYGLACYRPGGCEEVIRALAARIDARSLDPKLPRDCPLFVQKALCRFCAAGELNTCNVAEVGRGRRCRRAYSCPSSAWCLRAREPIPASKPAAAG